MQIKSLEADFSIAICRPTGDKWQSKTLFLAIFDPISSIFESVFDCRLSGVVIMNPVFHKKSVDTDVDLIFVFKIDKRLKSGVFST